MTNEELRMQFLSGVITEGEYKEKLEENKKSLNEHYVAGGIVGIQAINTIPPREKSDYETAFEHFLSERYEKEGVVNEEELEGDVEKISNIVKSKFPDANYKTYLNAALKKLKDGEELNAKNFVLTDLFALSEVLLFLMKDADSSTLSSLNSLFKQIKPAGETTTTGVAGDTE